jgi:hypothetical protein
MVYTADEIQSKNMDANLKDVMHYSSNAVSKFF